jgi:hypothetical protein
VRPGSATTVKWIAWLCVALSGWSARDLLADTPAPGNASGWTAAVQRPTYWAHDFVDSVGTVIHLLHPDSFYGSQFEVMKQKLLAAHIMHVRDGAMDAHGGFFNGDQATRFQELGRAGIRVTFITRLNISREFVQGFPARVSPAFEAYELPNELNIAHGVPWPTTIQVWMPIFYHYVKDNPATAAYPILGPSIADMGNDPYAQLGSQEQYLDYGNFHKYYRNYNPGTEGYSSVAQPPCDPLRYGSLNYELCHLAKVSGTKPIICTESGYGTDVPAGKQVTPDVQAKYIARLLLMHWLAGVRRTFIYQLADYGTDGFGAFGLLTADGTEKPAYVELSALMSELNDTAQANPPANLTLAVTGDFQGVATVLFQKSDGSYRLILWLEKPGWDPRSNMAIAVRDQNVSLSLPPPYRARRLLRFGDTGAATVQSPVPSGASLGLAVGDNLTIVDFARNGS